ncbi:MAG: hypothetical protein KAV00_03260 [Phycisphaerae bacterium]|nr:hypothetical protein [Phycisphaerae bacterium]
MKKEKEKMVVTSIRIPEELRDRVMEKAKDNGIPSLNALVIWLLRRYAAD